MLSVYIDLKLSWKVHISNVCKTVSKCMAMINSVNCVLQKDILGFLYISIIELHLTYCVEVWGSAYKGNLNPLYVMQKCLIQLITKSGNLDHTANLIKSFNMLLFSFNKVEDGDFYV